MSLLVVGSVALDSVRTPYGEVEEALGGSATYFSVSASFFTEVRLVAAVGADFPKEHLSFLKRRGVDLGGLQVRKGKTFRWKGDYSRDLNAAKTVCTQLNVLQDFKPQLPTAYRHSRYVFLANIDPRLQEDVLRQVHSPELIAADSMNFWIENFRDDLLRVINTVHIFLLNDQEARLLAGERNLVKAARAIAELGPKVIIIKKGDAGVFLFSKEFSFVLPSYLVESPYDPTGAGDAFAGGFMGYLARAQELNRSSLREAVVYGNIIASYNVEDFSLRALARLSGDEIQERYRAFRRLTQF